MVRTIDMQDMRHLNLFGKITKIDTRFCFQYNETIIFCVPRKLIARAIGEKGRNIQELSRVLRKRVKIIPQPKGIQDARQFIGDIVKPIMFKGLEIENNEIIINAGGTQSKAMLFGRNKRRLLEMQNIVKDFFGKELRIV
jgi:hypothetical protein